MTQSATKTVAVEEALRALRAACQPQGGGQAADGVASLLPSVAFLAARCTPALLSSVLTACDVTVLVDGAPKKLPMLNASWKLLLAIASHASISEDDFTTVMDHMLDQLRSGVLSHDWADKRRVRLATFFASHMVLAVRAHPEMLLTDSAGAQRFLNDLARLYFTICVTVATSDRDVFSLTALHDNILMRLHSVLDCLGRAAAAGARSVKQDEENGDSTSSPAHTVEQLLRQCVSLSAAREVEEAAGEGLEVRRTLATSALSAYLRVLHGALSAPTSTSRIKDTAESDNVSSSAVAGLTRSESFLDASPSKDSEVGDADEGSSGAASIQDVVWPLSSLQFFGESLLCWCAPTAEARRPPSTDGAEAAHLIEDADTTAADALKADIYSWSSALSPDVFAPPAVEEEASTAVTAATMSLRTLWVTVLRSLWLEWIHTCALAEGLLDDRRHDQMDEEYAGNTSSPSHDRTVRTLTEEAESWCRQLAAMMVSCVTCSSANAAAMNLMAQEAWAQVLHQLEVETAAGEPTLLQPQRIAQVILRVVTALRASATVLVESLLQLSLTQEDSDEEGSCNESVRGYAATSASVLQWSTAIITLVSYGEAVLGVDTSTDVSSSAARVMSQLGDVVRAQLGMPTLVQGSADGETISPSDRAAAALHDLLSGIQNLSRTSPKDGREEVEVSTAMIPLLLQVPVKLHVLVLTYAAGTPSPFAGHTIHAERDAARLALRTRLLQCASLLAFLTQILRTYAEAPHELTAESSSDTDLLWRVKAVRSDRRTVAQWVAARLLCEVAAVPLTDSAEDAVLLACVRRWIDVAFTTSVPSDAPHMVDSAAVAATVARVDAAASLLCLVEECTTLEPERLNLAEVAAQSLMSLVDGGDGETRDAATVLYNSNDVGWDGRPLQGVDRGQWEVAQAWLYRAKARSSTTSLVEVEGEETSDETPALNTAMGVLRGLRYCEDILVKIQQCMPSALSLTEHSGHDDNARKRTRRDRNEAGESDDKGWTANQVTLASALRRVHELSFSSLSQLQSIAVTTTTTSNTSSYSPGEALCTAPSEALQKPAKVTSPKLEKGKNRSDVAVVDLSSSEPLANNRRTSFPEVIDIE